MGFSEKAVIVSYVEMIYASIYGLAYVIVMLCLLAGAGIVETDEKFPQDKKTAVEVILFVLFLILGILLALTIYFTLILYKGVHQRDLAKLNRWFKFHAVIWIVGMVAEVGSIFESTMAKSFSGLVFLAYRAGALFVVRKFISELMDDPGVAAGKMEQGVHFQQKI